jgi:hypothetical protein
VDQLLSQKKYDVALVDARAGLSESTAAAIFGLGADLLLFGVESPQTFSSYRYLFAHLSRLPEHYLGEFLYRLRMVHAKASPDVTHQAAFRDKSYSLFSEFLYQDQPLLDEEGKPLLDESGDVLVTEQFGVDDVEAPHFAWPILADANFAVFDPLTLRSQLAPDFYQRTYAQLLIGIRRLMEDPKGDRDHIA